MSNHSSNTVEKIYKLYFRFLMIFPITTLFQANIFSNINKIMFAFVVVIQICLFIKSRFKVTHILIFMLLLLNYIFAILATRFPLNNFNDLFYYGFWVVFSVYILERVELVILYFKQDEKYIMGIIKLWTVLVFISIFLPSSYTTVWGGAKYFGSFAGSVFRLAPTAVMIMCLVIICMEIYKKKHTMVYTIIPMYCFYMGGSRTYLGVGLLLFMIIWYMYCPKTSVFYTTVIPLIVCAVILVSYSTMANKISATAYNQESYFDFWGTVTNGRTVFWKADIDAFISQPKYKQLFGSGFNFVYEVNLMSVGSNIWAHNDFINLILNFGVLGLLLYFYGLYSIKSKLFKNCVKVPRILLILFFFVWFINAMFNMFYTYFCSMLALPFLAIGLSYRYYNKMGNKCKAL